jgi:hypothetical protein
MYSGARRPAVVIALAALTGGTLDACTTPPLRPNGVVTLSSAGLSSAPAREVALATVRGPAAPASVQATAANCPSGTTASGGGISTTLVGGGRPPSSLHADGTAPGGPGGQPPVRSAIGRPAWIALGATGGQLVLGAVTTAYAICLRGAPLGTPTVVVAAVPGPGVAATTARATAACPSAGVLLGGGGLATVTKGSASPSLHLIGSYPSDSHGLAAARSSTGPTAWSAVADAGGRTGSGVQTIAFAICGSASRAHTAVAAVSAPGPLPASSATTVTADCPSSTELISGGAQTGPASGEPQQGLHLTGAFPSSPAGAGVGSSPAAASADSWTARSESGGQGSPGGTVTTAFAVCLKS